MVRHVLWEHCYVSNTRQQDLNGSYFLSNASGSIHTYNDDDGGDDDYDDVHA